MEVYRCHPCDTNFQSKASLSDHLDNKHLNDNNECFLCSRKISCRANLSRHLKEVLQPVKFDFLNSCIN